MNKHGVLASTCPRNAQKEARRWERGPRLKNKNNIKIKLSLEKPEEAALELGMFWRWGEGMPPLRFIKAASASRKKKTAAALRVTCVWTRAGISRSSLQREQPGWLSPCGEMTGGRKHQAMPCK